MTLEGFFPGRVQEAETILARYGTEAHEREPEGVHAAAVGLSGGDIAELRRLIDLAKQDPRSILRRSKLQRKGVKRS